MQIVVVVAVMIGGRGKGWWRRFFSLQEVVTRL
jgi:hypothetical protein